MGTFIIRPTSFAGGGTPIIDAGSIPNDYAGYTLDSYPPTTFLQCALDQVGATDLQSVVFTDVSGSSFYSDTLRYLFSGTCIYLDGSVTPISLSDLPTGFIVATCAIKVNIGFVQQPGVGSANYYLQFDINTEGPANTSSFNLPVNKFIQDIIIDGCGIRSHIVVLDNSDVGSVSNINNLRIEGTYTIQQFHFTTDGLRVPPSKGFIPSSGSNVKGSGIGSIYPGYNWPPAIPPSTYIPDLTISSIQTGDLIRITSVDLDLTTLTGLILSLKDKDGKPITIDIFIWIIYIIPTLIIARIPPYIPLVFEPTNPIPDGPPIIPVVITIVVTGAEFTGSIPLDPILVILADISGLYQLKEDKTNDTIYNHLFPARVSYLQNFWLLNLDLWDIFLINPNIQLEMLEWVDGESLIPENMIFANGQYGGNVGHGLDNTSETKILDPFAVTGFIGG